VIIPNLLLSLKLPKIKQEFKRGESPSFYKQIPLPLSKGKGIQGIGLLTLIVGGSPAQPIAKAEESQLGILI